MPQDLKGHAGRSAGRHLAYRDIPEEHQAMLDWAEEFALTEVAGRAAQYDRAAAFPEEDIDVLWKRGLLLSNLPRRHGGLGFGVDSGEPLSFLFMIRNLAHGSSSSAH